MLLVIDGWTEKVHFDLDACYYYSLLFGFARMVNAWKPRLNRRGRNMTDAGDLEDCVKTICSAYLQPKSESSFSGYERSKRRLLAECEEPVGKRLLSLFAAEEDKWLSPLMHRADSLLQSVWRGLEERVFSMQAFTEPMFELMDMLYPCGCASSVSIADHLLSRDIGSLVRVAAKYLTQIAVREDSEQFEELLCLDHTLHLGALLCSSPERSESVIGYDPDFLSALVGLLHDVNLSRMALFLVWGLLENAKHQVYTMSTSSVY